jgi:hypothetical protein
LMNLDFDDQFARYLNHKQFLKLLTFNDILINVRSKTMQLLTNFLSESNSDNIQMTTTDADAYIELQGQVSLTLKLWF